jgi:hypothetical protein
MVLHHRACVYLRVSLVGCYRIALGSPPNSTGYMLANARIHRSLFSRLAFIDGRDRAFCRRGKTGVQDTGRSGEARLSELLARRGQLNEIVAEQNRFRSLDDGSGAHSKQNQPTR